METTWGYEFQVIEMSEEQQNAHREELEELFQANERSLFELGL
jgi:hypothetical protein